MYGFFLCAGVTAAGLSFEEAMLLYSQNMSVDPESLLKLGLALLCLPLLVEGACFGRHVSAKLSDQPSCRKADPWH